MAGHGSRVRHPVSLGRSHSQAAPRPVSLEGTDPTPGLLTPEDIYPKQCPSGGAHHNTKEPTVTPLSTDVPTSSLQGIHLIRLKQLGQPSETGRLRLVGPRL